MKLSNNRKIIVAILVFFTMCVTACSFNFISLMKNYTEFKELTQEILYSFVDRIEIGKKEKFSHNTQKIKIIYNFIGAVDIPQE